MKGCLIGCLALVVLVVVACGGLAYMAVEFDLVWSAEPHDTLAYLGGAPVVVGRIEPDHDDIISMIALGTTENPEARKFVHLFVPYEASVAVNLDVDASQTGATAAISMRRGAGMFAWTFAHADKPLSLGFGDVIQTAEEEPGLLVMRTQWPTSDTSRAQLLARWSQPPPEPLTLEGGHIVELVIDNRAGGAFLALEPALQAMQEGQTPPIPPEENAHVRQLLLRANWLRLKGDLVDRGETSPVEPYNPAEPPDVDAVLTLTMEAQDEAAAAEAVTILNALRETAVNALRQDEGIEVKGEFLQEGRLVRGELTVEGVARPIIEEIRRGAS